MTKVQFGVVCGLLSLAISSYRYQASGTDAALRSKVVQLALEKPRYGYRRLHVLLRQARLGQIDAIVGKKKKLEIEISNLSKGRFPPEMFGKLHVEGLIGDDEEYWPFEGEYWSDEYENYK